MIEDLFSEFLDVGEAQRRLADPEHLDYESDRTARLGFVLDSLLPHLRRRAEASVVIDRLSTALGLDVGMCASLLREYVKHPDADGVPTIEVFLRAEVRGYQETLEVSDQPRIPTASDMPDAFAAYRRVDKVALILKRFHLTPEDIPWVLVQGPAQGTIDVQTLPMAVGAPSASFAAWARLRDAVALRRTASSGKLFDLFTRAATAEANGDPEEIRASHEDLLTSLVERTRSSRSDTEELVGRPARNGTPPTPGKLGVDYPSGWKDERAFKRLDEVMSVVNRVGLDVKILWPWRQIPRPENSTVSAQKKSLKEQRAQSREIQQAVRARVGESRWHRVARALRDRLREQQRAALVGWLVAREQKDELCATDLYEHFLLDIDMSPCQLTSRIKQAISTVQLFVQRALMNLETEPELSTDDAREWQWMKNYRVWEANRKVFLYPENWIEPELRDDKTPLFEDLENELLQGEVTADAAEQAAMRYLESLDEVARLEVVGLFHQKDQGIDLLHVFGRTRGTPARYFYRQRVDGAYWTPWEEVEAEIEGNHVLPVVYGGRLYLFWTQITQSAVEEVPDTPAGPGPDLMTQSKPDKFYQLRLAWSERRSESWAPKTLSSVQVGQTTSDFLRQRFGLLKTDDSAPHEFFFRAYEVGGDLILEPIRAVHSGDSGAISYIRLDRFRLSGCDGTVTLNKVTGPDDVAEDPGIDAVLEWRTENNRIYFFKGSQYIRWDTNDKQIDDGYPRPISGNFPGWPDSFLPPEVEIPPSGGMRIRLPAQTNTRNQSFARTTDGGGLSLPARNPTSGVPEMEPTLSLTPTAFELVPLRLANFQSRSPFFFQDRGRTFLVEPRDHHRWPRQEVKWSVADNIPLDPVRALPDLGVRPLPRADDPWRFDAVSLVRAPSAIDMQPMTRSSAAPSSRSGLLSMGAHRLANSLGARAAYVAQERASVETNRVAVRSTARILGEGGAELLTLRSAEPPDEAAAMRIMILNTTHRVPDATREDVRSGPFLGKWEGKRYRFSSFYHPYLCTLMRQVNRLGVEGMLDPSPTGPEPKLRRQMLTHRFFEAVYGPTAVDRPYPKDEFDFSHGGSYSVYNWELFFHVPFLIACHLSKNRRFEEAQRWLHYIFDPTESSNALTPQRFWKLRPFFELFHDENAEAGPIHELLLLLQYTGSDPEKLQARDQVIDQITQWRKNPFNPHAIARLRLTAYQKAVVMKYIDNLIEWGDQLFRRDSMESINEATQLYILAAEILGPRPNSVEVPSHKTKTFNELLKAGLDEFSNALVEELEGFLPDIAEGTSEYGDEGPILGATLFFCVPPNDKLVTDYWDRVADRLFKIRYCMNIEGGVRELPLFEPPIDPALLVRAAAEGIDLASALSELNAPLPHHRYQVLAQKATELCGDVRSLGQALLSALEKRDAEELSLLRAGQEVTLQTSLRRIRENQIEEARQTLESVKSSKASAELRLQYYRSRAFMNAAESVQVELLMEAGLLDLAAGTASLGGAAAAQFPNLTFGTAGFGGSPLFTEEWGRDNFAIGANSMGSHFQVAARALDRAGQLAGMLGSYQRRQDDWGLQGDLAQKEIEAIQKQILAAEIRVAVAEQELEGLDQQIESTKESEAFLRNKYTSKQLYQWMVGQLSSVYFQSYQLAYEMAKRAERACQFELAAPDKTFIQFGYWDSLKKGLLAGDRLHYDIKRMEAAYLKENKREYELTRHVSLRQLDPIALLQLRHAGECFVRIPEAWFDLDSAGHYMRRIKTMAISLPSVTGPYVPVRCTVTSLRSSIRLSPDVESGYERHGADDARFRDDALGLQSIVTSHANQDSGLFETNLSDARYLPFEGFGVIDSEWRIELPKEFRQFDYSTISDVILHFRYTARDGGAELKQAAEDKLRATLQKLVLGSQVAKPSGEGEGLLYVVSLKRDFSDLWARFLTPPDTETDQSVTLTIDRTIFPFELQSSTIGVAGLELIMVIDDVPGYGSGAPVRLDVLAPGDSVAQPVELISLEKELGGMPHNGPHSYDPTKQLGEWMFTFNEADNESAAATVVVSEAGHRRLNSSDVRDLVIAFRYKVSA